MPSNYCNCEKNMIEELIKIKDTVPLTEFIDLVLDKSGIKNEYLNEKTLELKLVLFTLFVIFAAKSITIILYHITDDNNEYIKELSQFIKTNIKNVTRVDFLPYHKMGLEKYEKLGIKCPYQDVPAMDKVKCDKLHEEFMKDFSVN